MNLSNFSQPEYLHILINHLPIIGLMVAVAFLTAFLLLRNRAGAAAGMVAVALLALLAWPVMSTGEGAYEKINQLADEAGKAYLDRHMELAERWIYLYVSTAIVAGAGLLAARKRPQLLFPSAVATLVLAAGCLIAGAVIAENGGMIRHPEFRSGPPPQANHLDDHEH